MVNKDFPGAVAQGSDGSGEPSHIDVDVFAEVDIGTSGFEATIQKAFSSVYLCSSPVTLMGISGFSKF